MGPGDFTLLLSRYREGDSAAQAQLIRLMYADLRHIAHGSLRGGHWGGSTLHTTAVVNESYFRLVSPAARHVETRTHFLRLASRVMRQVICDYARKRLREANHLGTVPLDTESAEVDKAEIHQARQLALLDSALDDLAKIKPRHAQVIECRFFVGLSEQETAETLDISLRSVQRDWSEARQWLLDHVADH